jgi:hypothetical protein
MCGSGYIVRQFLNSMSAGYELVSRVVSARYINKVRNFLRCIGHGGLPQFCGMRSDAACDGYVADWR